MGVFTCITLFTCALHQCLRRLVNYAAREKSLRVCGTDDGSAYTPRTFPILCVPHRANDFRNGPCAREHK